METLKLEIAAGDRALNSKTEAALDTHIISRIAENRVKKHGKNPLSVGRSPSHSTIQRIGRAIAPVTANAAPKTSTRQRAVLEVFNGITLAAVMPHFEDVPPQLKCSSDAVSIELGTKKGDRQGAVGRGFSRLAGTPWAASRHH